MVRTQIQLTEQQWQALKSLAARRGVSVAELIRQSVGNLMQASRDVSDEERKQRAIRAAGRFRSGHADVSVDHDRYLAESYAK
jgi:hypothetical protein